MTTTGIASAIATIANGTTAVVNGVTITVKGIDPPPDALNTAPLPCVYPLIGSADYDTTSEGSDNYLVTRDYTLQCAIDPKDQSSRSIKELKARQFIDALVAKLMKYPTLDGLAGVREARVLRDTGSAEIEDNIPGAVSKSIYNGFEIVIQVTELISRTYAALE